MAARRSQAWSHRPTARAIDAELLRLGGRLKELRLERELTLEQASVKTRIHAVSLSRIETGTNNVTVATLVAIALGYGVPLAELFVAPEELC